MKLSIIIPAYNEEKTLETLLNRVIALEVTPAVKEIIVVDDGSTDRTAKILSAYENRVLVITHQKNRGKGAAVRSGFARASGEYVVVQDADLEYDPQDLARMLSFALSKHIPVLYGSRRLPLPTGQKRGSWYFYLGGLGITWASNVLYGLHLTDEPTCYKMIRRDIVAHLTLTANGFEFCPEVTAKIARLGVPIVEMPIHYEPRSQAEGKKIRAKDGVIAIWTLLKYRFFDY